MSESEPVTFFLGAVCGCLLFVGILITTHATYMDGQIDAINGDIKYHLVTQDNGTTDWEVIKK